MPESRETAVCVRQLWLNQRAGDKRDEVIRFFKDHHTVVDPTLSWGELLGRPMNVDIASFEPGFVLLGSDPSSELQR